VALVAMGALLGLGYRFTGNGDEHSYGFWLRESVLLLSGVATATTQADEHGPHAIVQLIGAIGGLVVPALALGIVVFKAFVKDRVFVPRRKLALLDPSEVDLDLPKQGDDDSTKWLAFRLYSSTRLQLVDLRFEAYARVVGQSPTRASVVTNAKLTLLKDHWPIGLSHVPYTLYCPLRESDLDDEGRRLTRVFAQGRDYKLADGCDILMIVTGRVPELGTEVVESHWFSADTDLSDGFGEIKNVSYPPDKRTWKVSKRWDNWLKFDDPD
jgi:hypothetical protein